MAVQSTDENRAEIFLKDSFVKNPSYSFGDWTIMYNHSVMVKKFALQIAKNVTCDEELLTIEALWHDIGKVYKTDEETLRKDHSKLGYEVAKFFIDELELNQGKKLKLIEFLKGEKASIESQIIDDADIISFLADERLQQAFTAWAEKNGLKNEIKRKLGKYHQLHFEISKNIASPYVRKSN